MCSFFWGGHKTQKIKELSDIAATKFFLFLSTYLCELNFSAFTSIKMESRNKIGTQPYLFLAISNIHPWVQ